MVEDLCLLRAALSSPIRRSGHGRKSSARNFANRIRRRSGRFGDKWHLDEVVVSIAGKKQWLWRAVDHDGFVLDVLVQSRRNAKAAERLMRKLLKKQGCCPPLMFTDKPRSYATAKRQIMPGVEHRRY
jgi:putative transposase